MDTQLLDAIRIIVREEISSSIKNLEKKLDARLQKQDDKLDTILEAWSIQKIHRQELDDHEKRITTIEHHIPAIG